MRKFRLILLGCVVLLMGCDESPAQAPPGAAGSSAAAPAPPPTDPATLPKVPANFDSIRQMIQDRFGAELLRTLRIEVDDRAGLRVRITGEVPSEQIRKALIREIEVRVEGLQVSDINLDIAGPVPMLMTFDVRLHHSNPILFSPDLSLAVTMEGEIFETATGRRINRLNNLDLPEINSMAFSPDGKLLATGHRNAAIVLWDMPAGATRRVLVPPDQQALSARTFAIQFMPDGKSIVTINERRGELMIWDVASGSGRLIGTHLPNDSPSAATVYAMAIAPDGKTIATANERTYDDDAVILWDVDGRTRREVLKAELFHPRDLAWSGDGRYLAAARCNRPNPGTVLVWDMTTKHPKPFVHDRGGEVDVVAFSPDSKTLLIRYRDLGIDLWDFAAGSRWQNLHRDKVGVGAGIRFSPDGNVLATECGSLEPAGVRLWNIAARPGASGAAKLPQAYPNVAYRDDLLAATLEKRIRGTFDRRNIESLMVEVLPDASVRLTGRVSSAPVRDNAARTAETHGAGGEIVRTPRKVINNLEVTGRYGP